MENRQEDTSAEQTAPTRPDRTGPVRGDIDQPGETPDEVQPGEGGDTDTPDPEVPEIQPDEGDVDFPAETPEEQPSIDPNPATILPPD